jgi:hypothetical protein
MATTTGTGRGGARPGAGRKPTREKYASKIAAAEKKIADRLPGIVDSLLELAGGVTVQEIGLDGEARVYTQKPDFKAASYLMDRIMGKPVTAIEAEVSGDGVGAVLAAFGVNVMKAYGDSDQPHTAGDSGESTESDTAGD